jgi:hypothetical protein
LKYLKRLLFNRSDRPKTEPITETIDLPAESGPLYNMKIGYRMNITCIAICRQNINIPGTKIVNNIPGTFRDVKIFMKIDNRKTSGSPPSLIAGDITCIPLVH